MYHPGREQSWQVEEARRKSPEVQDVHLVAETEQVRQGGEQTPHLEMEDSVYWNVPGLVQPVQVDEGER